MGKDITLYGLLSPLAVKRRYWYTVYWKHLKTADFYGVTRCNSPFQLLQFCWCDTEGFVEVARRGKAICLEAGQGSSLCVTYDARQTTSHSISFKLILTVILLWYSGWTRQLSSHSRFNSPVCNSSRLLKNQTFNFVTSWVETVFEPFRIIFNPFAAF